LLSSIDKESYCKDKIIHVVELVSFVNRFNLKVKLIGYLQILIGYW